MSIDEFKSESKQTHSTSKDVIQDEEEIKNIILDSDVIVLDYESRRGGYSCKCKCKECGDTFRKGISRIKRGDGKYCSMECSSEGRTGVSQKNIDTDSIELYYIAGLVYGDGHLRHIQSTGNYNVSFTNTSLDLIDSFKTSVEDIGGVVNLSTHVRNNDNHSDCYTAKVSSLSLYDKMKSDFSSPSDVSDSCNTRSQKLRFIQGFYEAEGSIQKYRLRMSQKDRSILNLLSDFIDSEIGIDSVVRQYDNDYHNLVVSSSADVESFIDEVDPVIKRGNHG